MRRTQYLCVRKSDQGGTCSVRPDLCLVQETVTFSISQAQRNLRVTAASFQAASQTGSISRAVGRGTPHEEELPRKIDRKNTSHGLNVAMRALQLAAVLRLKVPVRLPVEVVVRVSFA